MGCLAVLLDMEHDVHIDVSACAPCVIDVHRIVHLHFLRGLGALAMDDIDWEAIIAETVPAKFLDLNLAAYRAGRDAAQ